MELATYFGIVKKRWLIASLGLFATMAFTAVFALGQPPAYESSATYVVRPRAVDSEETVRAIDTLIRGVEINSTYANIAESDLIKSLARDLVDPSVDTSGLSTSATVVTGTNVLELSVKGENPESVYALTVALGEATVAYIDSLDDAFQLVPLDAPREPKNPVGPNTRLTIITGAFVGIFIGTGLAVGLEAITSPRRRGEEAEDEEAAVGGEGDHSGDRVEVIGDSEFNEIFAEHLENARRNNTSFTIGMLSVVRAAPNGARDTTAGPDSVERVARAAMPPYRRQGRLLAVDRARYVVVEPQLPPEEAEELIMVWLSVWKAAIELADLVGDGDDVDLRVSIGVASYGGEDTVEVAETRPRGLTA